MVDITFLGHSSFKVRGRGSQVVIDPPDSATRSIEADIVLLTNRGNQAHANIAKVKKTDGSSPFIIQGPGEYEIGGVNIVGAIGETAKEENGGGQSITIYQFLLDGLSFAHLGSIGEKLSQKQIELLGNIDILMLPVGGTYSVDPKGAVEIIAQLEPKIVLPMHYSTKDMEDKLLPLDAFLAQIGEKIQTEKKFSIARDRLPDETQVKVLENLG